MLPSIAVIIPCLNAERWIARAIQSVLRQNLSPSEVIVVDDGSTDGSLPIIKCFGDSVRWFSGANRGACAARNIGLAAINSDYVLFLDADDWVEGEFLGSLASAAIAEPYDMFLSVHSGDILRMWSHGNSLVKARNSDDVFRAYARGDYVQTGGILWRSEFLRRIGGWNEKVLRGQDIELVFRSLALGGRAKVVATSGKIIWFQHDGKSRISKRADIDAVKSEIDFHNDLLPHVDHMDYATQMYFGRRYYNLATEAYFCKACQAGDRSLSQARRLGFRGHVALSPLSYVLKAVLGPRFHEDLRRIFGRTQLKRRFARSQIL
jgi:glycosyltransferase involved in cell wall biosynthesis